MAAASVLLPVLPVAGVWALTGRRREGLAIGLLAWPILLLAGLPGYFPGEVSGAISTGMAVFASPGGAEVARSAARLGTALSAPVEATDVGHLPAEAATVPGPECPPPSAVTATDAVALPYEGQGHSLAIPVEFGDVELQMLFDTGASLTTLDRASLRRIGVAIPSDAPEVTLRTANGERTARLVLIPKVWVGGLLVEGVTVGLCEECAGDRTSGLLGLNVSGQFLVTVDTARKEVVFQVRQGGVERIVDISPWMDVKATATLYPDERVEVAVEAVNNAARDVQSAKVGIRCGEQTFEVTLPAVPAGDRATKSATLPRGTNCDRYRVTLESARW